ncbi:MULTISPECIES: LAETG motif-containing sortase-dependent surface protein [unclassified Streptomyces]|uniref:LAETG motif-containing sortase-dependent surface protein n=1 Tax=unclassified Streptomyces TaxID=2593676 RepID=UPI002E2AD066|nr:LAETG motif-containing sortase-dependent surface protein [Streptomyces sp. NBC_00223]
MSISRRTSLTVRSIGVASAAAALALGVAGNAFACSITEFTAAASCDDGHGVITVTDKDTTTFVTITVSQGKNQVGSQTHVKGTKAGLPVAFSVDWQPSTTYTVRVVKENQRHDVVGTKQLKTPRQACVTTPPADNGGNPPADDNPPADNGDNPPVDNGDNPPADNGDNPPADNGDNPPADNGDNPPADNGDNPPAGNGDNPPADNGDTPVDSTTTSPATADTTSPAAVVDDTNSPSPSGATNLAETGGGSSTGMIAGIAGALVALGGGAVFMLRRRTPAARH